MKRKNRVRLSHAIARFGVPSGKVRASLVLLCVCLVIVLAPVAASYDDNLNDSLSPPVIAFQSGENATARLVVTFLGLRDENGAVRTFCEPPLIGRAPPA